MILLRFLRIVAFGASLCTSAHAQSIIGLVIDKNTSAPLVGATVEIPGADPVRGAVCDTIGQFVVGKLVAGRYDVRVSYLGYDAQLIPQVLVSNGMDAELLVEMEENTQLVQTVTIVGKTKKEKPVNRLAKLSAIALNPETVSRFSGGRGNIARMAANYAGIGATDDFQNQIVVRGNTPASLLWRLEGVPIPSPGHLKTFVNTGGGFNALNPTLLGQSDFLTGAFPAEYGNTIAGVMDLQYRSGNKERFMATAQIGSWSGVEATVEGPILRKWNGSFIAGYRYSFIDLFHRMGIELAGRYAPQYQDLNWKMDFNRGRQRLRLFGLAGKSHVFVSGPDADPDKAYTDPTENYDIHGALSTTGLRYQVMLDSVSYLRAFVTFSTSDLDDKSYRQADTPTPVLQGLDVDRVRTGRLSLLWQRRQTRRVTLRGGMLTQVNRMNSRKEVRTDEGDFIPWRRFDGQLWLWEGFAQMQYKVKKRYSYNIGLHIQHLPLNGNTTVEPRTALKFKLPDDNDLVFAYGLHTQAPNLSALLYTDSAGVLVNRELAFEFSHQGVVSWTKKWPGSWHSRVEMYYQGQSRIPVQRIPSGFSLLNAGASYYSDLPSPMVSDGLGANYGIEFTLTRSYRQGFYTLLTGSFFESRYRGSDGVWRNTAFNAGYIVNAMGGKEFKVGRGTVLTLDGKFSASGGRWYTPIALEESIAAGFEVENAKEAFSRQYPDFLRLDLKGGIRINRGRFTHTLFLDVTNVTNRRNVYAYRFFRSDTQLRTQYQLGLTPDFVYRIQF